MLSQAVPFPLFMETSDREQTVKECNPNVTGFKLHPSVLHVHSCALIFFQVALALNGPEAESCAVGS